MTDTDRPWLCVRVTHHTWEQTTVSRHHSQRIAEALAALYDLAPRLARLWGARHHNYEAWRETPPLQRTP